jgi:hypothetical protein
MLQEWEKSDVIAKSGLVLRRAGFVQAGLMNRFYRPMQIITDTGKSQHQS